MRAMMGGPLFLLLGAVVGVASAVAVLGRYGADAAAPGIAWDSWDVGDGNDAQPYAVGHFLIDGRFPPSAGQMLEFSAGEAGDGSSLHAACAYLVTAKSAPDRWWSLTAYASGAAAAPANAILSAETAVVESDGSLRVAVSRWPSAGNWIRPPVPSGFALLLTVAEPSPNQGEPTLPLFTIEKAGC